MPMIIAGGGAASVYTGEGHATVEFLASGTGRITSSSVSTTITPVQNNSSCSGGNDLITVALPDLVTSGDFLAACITLTDGATVTSITDQIEGYDAAVGALGPVAWWKFNELSGDTAYDSGSGDNDGAITGGVLLGFPGPIVGMPSDTAYNFANTEIPGGLQGTGLTGYSLQGSGPFSQYGEVTVASAPDLQFGTGSFTVAGWINAATGASVNGYIFNSITSGTNASVSLGPLGSAIRGMGLMGGGLFINSTAGYALQMNPTTYQIEFEIGDSSGNSISLETPLSYANSWHFVVGVVDRSAQLMHIYVDGMLIGSDSITSVGSVTNTGVAPSMGDGIIGDLSQIFLTDYALTAGEIAALYQASFETPAGNRWIQAAYSYNDGYGSEIWYARGVKSGVTIVDISLSLAAPCCANVSEWSGVWYVDPLDQWSQNFGTSAVAATQGVTPRVGSDLFLAAVSSASDITSVPSGEYTSLPFPGIGGYGAGYYVSPFDVSESTSWSTAASVAWATCHASFVPGPMALNPDLQIPETLVEISTTQNYMAPLQGFGVWTNMTYYVRSFTTTGPGKNHLLDRIEATTSNIVVNNRTGQFNRWNDLGTYYNNGLGLLPMNPIKITAAWDGITSAEFYGYLQAITPHISDVLNIDVEIDAMDILGILNLAYLAGNNYEQLLLAGG